MASSATVTGKTGTQSAATAHTYASVQRIEIFCPQNLVRIYSATMPNPADVEIATGATITLTNTGGNYVLSIT